MHLGDVEWKSEGGHDRDAEGDAVTQQRNGDGLQFRDFLRIEIATDTGHVETRGALDRSEIWGLYCVSGYLLRTIVNILRYTVLNIVQYA